MNINPRYLVPNTQPPKPYSANLPTTQNMKSHSQNNAQFIRSGPSSPISYAPPIVFTTSGPQPHQQSTLNRNVHAMSGPQLQRTTRSPDAINISFNQNQNQNQRLVPVPAPPGRISYYISGPQNRQIVTHNINSASPNSAARHNPQSNSPANSGSGKHKSTVNFHYLNGPNQVQQQSITYQIQQPMPVPVPMPIQNIQTVQTVQTVHTITHTQIYWEQKFIEIYSKFEIFVQKFELMIQDVFIIEEQFETVNNEEEWNELRNNYSQLISKFNQVKEDIIIVLQENKKVIQNLSPETIQKFQGEEIEEKREEQQEGAEKIEGEKEGKDNVWEQRYYELLQQYELISEEYGDIKNQINTNLQKSHSSKGDQETQIKELENSLNILHREYQDLEANYNKLSEAYSAAVAKLQDDWNQEAAQKMIEQLQAHAQNADERIEYLQGQLEAADSGSNQKNHIMELTTQIEKQLQQKKELINSITNLNEELQKYDSQLVRKEQIIEENTITIKKYEEQYHKMMNRDEKGDHVDKNEINRLNTLLVQRERELEQYQRVIEDRQKVIESIASSRSEVVYMHEVSVAKMKEYELTISQKTQEIQRLEVLIKQLRSSETNSGYSEQSLRQKIRVEVEEAVADKNRKIKLLTQQIEQLHSQVQKVQAEKRQSIKQIKEYFTEEEDKNNSRMKEKDNNIKLLQQKIRSLEHELSNRNLQISRFRHQPPQNASTNEQIRKLNDTLERKNNEIQQLRKSFENKTLNVKELEQKLQQMEQQLSSRVFEVNNLKKEIYETQSGRAEIDNLNGIIKKKNQQINELKLSQIEKEQLKVNIGSLEREKIRLNEYLKEKTRQCESKDTTIASLEKKIHASLEEGASKPSYKADGSANSNYENIIKQKQSEIKKLKYELELIETTVSANEKSIREMNTKVSTHQRTNSILKADMENRSSRYEKEIKDLNKEIKDLKNTRQENGITIDSMKVKITSLENSLEERNALYDKEVSNYKYKLLNIEKANTALVIDLEVSKNDFSRLNKENKELKEKIQSLQDKIQAKNAAIEQIKLNYIKKQKQDSKVYQDRIKDLDGLHKLESIKIKKYEQQVNRLNEKVKNAEIQKRSYRERLITETSNDRNEFMEMRMMSQQYDSMTSGEILEMNKFKLKDPQANDVFERKVIYQLKKQNDILRKQLSSMGGLSQFSGNRQEKYDSINQQMSMYIQDLETERQKERHEDHNQDYYRSKNKELQIRIDELIKVNNELKERVAAMSAGGNHEMLVQFYKDQTVGLEREVNQLKSKIRQLIDDNNKLKEDSGTNDSEFENLRQKNKDLDSQVSAQKSKIRSYEIKITEFESEISANKNQIQQLKEVIEKERKGYDDLSKKNRTDGELKVKLDRYEEEITKLANRASIQAAEIERLNEQLGSSTQEKKKLKIKISELEKELALLKLDVPKKDDAIAYKLELLRSLYIEMGTLVEQIPLSDRSSQSLVNRIQGNVKQGLAAIKAIST